MTSGDSRFVDGVQMVSRWAELLAPLMRKVEREETKMGINKYNISKVGSSRSADFQLCSSQV